MNPTLICCSAQLASYLKLFGTVFLAKPSTRASASAQKTECRGAKGVNWQSQAKKSLCLVSSPADPFAPHPPSPCPKVVIQRHILSSLPPPLNNHPSFQS